MRGQHLTRFVLVFCFHLIPQFHSGVRFVLRKKPAGKLVSQTAHQVEREYAVPRRTPRGPERVVRVKPGFSEAI